MRHALTSLADRYGPALVFGLIAVVGLRWAFGREVDPNQLGERWSAERSMRETRR